MFIPKMFILGMICKKYFFKTSFFFIYFHIPKTQYTQWIILPCIFDW